MEKRDGNERPGAEDQGHGRAVRETFHGSGSGRGDHIVVFGAGTLYGEGPDGTPSDGDLYVDRFETRDGKITRIGVLDDSAERLLTRQTGEPDS
ncbi:hypothetical protein [Nisaea sp.]|uniref:hypothetical protein n=1 Tax=Nisaea sp. TaxID=2024842 RepID=UPI003B521D2F